jgi:hypothetical protein
VGTVLDSTESWAGAVRGNGARLHTYLVWNGSGKPCLIAHRPGQEWFVETMLDFTEPWSGILRGNGA